MAVDRYLWKAPFRVFPIWPCPGCSKGRLVQQQDSLKVVETGPSKRSFSDENWDPDWVTKRFSAILRCNNPQCEEVCSISGTTVVDWFIDVGPDDEPEQFYDDCFIPKMIYPPPPIIDIPSSCPNDIKDHIYTSFSLIWADHSSCANRLRVAVEAVLNDRGIPKFNAPKAGKRRDPLSLHARIKRYSAKDSDAATYLEAIKWLGNYGSHALDPLTLSDVLQAFELFEHALKKIYAPPDTALRTARKINKRKRPLRERDSR